MLFVVAFPILTTTFPEYSFTANDAFSGFGAVEEFKNPYTDKIEQFRWSGAISTIYFREQWSDYYRLGCRAKQITTLRVYAPGQKQTIMYISGIEAQIDDRVRHIYLLQCLKTQIKISSTSNFEPTSTETRKITFAIKEIKRGIYPIFIRKYIKWTSAIIVSLLFVILSIINVWLLDRRPKITHALILSLLMLIYWDIVQKPEMLRLALQAYVFGAYVLVGSSLYNYVNGIASVSFEGRYSATGVNAVDLALILILGMPIAIHLYFSAGQEKGGMFFRIVNLAYIPLAIFTTILSGSRTSLLAGIPFGVYLVTSAKIKYDRKILVLGGLIISILAMYFLVPQSIKTRLATLATSIETGDIGGRVELWRQAIMVFASHPVGGLGSGTLETFIGTAAHNTFISVLAETGLVGFVLFGLILVLVVLDAFNNARGNSGLWVSLFFTWVIGVCSLSWEFRKLTWLLLSFIVIDGNSVLEQSTRLVRKKISWYANRSELNGGEIVASQSDS
jgi:O-antigen ligase